MSAAPRPVSARAMSELFLVCPFIVYFIVKVLPQSIEDNDQRLELDRFFISCMSPGNDSLTSQLFSRRGILCY